MFYNREQEEKNWNSFGTEIAVIVARSANIKGPLSSGRAPLHNTFCKNDPSSNYKPDVHKRKSLQVARFWRNIIKLSSDTHRNENL